MSYRDGNMASKKASSTTGGGILVFIGSLIYLYIFFAWYGSGSAIGSWVNAAYFLGPFVIAFALVSAISLFFMGLGRIAGKSPSDAKMGQKILWNFLMLGGISFLILTGASGWFYWAVLGFVISYIGGIAISQ